MVTYLDFCREKESKKENTRPDVTETQTDKVFVNSKIAAFENKGENGIYDTWQNKEFFCRNIKVFTMKKWSFWIRI